MSRKEDLKAMSGIDSTFEILERGNRKDDL
jgi:hypothetical protein